MRTEEEGGTELDEQTSTTETVPVCFSFLFFCKICEEIERHWTDRTSIAQIERGCARFFIEWTRRYAVGGERWRMARGEGEWEGTYELMSLVCPYADTRRRYGMKEKTLAPLIQKSCFRRKGLLNADTTCDDLAGQVEQLWTKECMTSRDTKSIKRVNVLLDMLATHSRFSNLFGDGTVAPKCDDTRERIIRALYEDLGPLEAKWMTRIILQEDNFGFASAGFWMRQVQPPYLRSVYQTRFDLKSACEIVDTMRTCDDLLPETFTSWPLLPSPLFLELRTKWFPPQVGSPLQPAESRRGHSVGHVITQLSRARIRPRVPEAFAGHPLSAFEDASKAHELENSVAVPVREIAAELKYDGERIQVHVDLDAVQDPVHSIQLYSRSGRNSTFDRFRAHPIVLGGFGSYLRNVRDLGLDSRIADRASQLASKARRPRRNLGQVLDELGLRDRFSLSGGKVFSLKNIVLDGELLAYNEKTNMLETMTTVLRDHAEFKSHPDIVSGTRHYYMVYFDILILNSYPVLSLSYTRRRALLEALIHPIEHFVNISEMRTFHLPQTRMKNKPLEDKRVAKVAREISTYFADIIARKEEGLVLKAVDGAYEPADSGHWYKLKTNYVAGLGDTIDLCIVACGWLPDRKWKDKQPTVLKHSGKIGSSKRREWVQKVPGRLFVGVLENKEEVCSKKTRPRFSIVFYVDYGFTENHFNRVLRSKAYLIQNVGKPKLDFDVNPMCEEATNEISHYFSNPFVVEIEGSAPGFVKPRNARSWAVRFPKVVKLRLDVDWKERENHVLSFDELQRTAEEAINIGRRASPGDVEDAAEKIAERMPEYAKASRPYSTEDSYSTSRSKSTTASTSTGNRVDADRVQSGEEEQADAGGAVISKSTFDRPFLVFGSADAETDPRYDLPTDILDSFSEDEVLSDHESIQLDDDLSSSIVPVPLSGANRDLIATPKSRPSLAYWSSPLLEYYPRQNNAAIDSPIPARSSPVLLGFNNNDFITRSSPTRALVPSTSMNLLPGPTTTSPRITVCKPRPSVPGSDDDLLTTLASFKSANYAFASVLNLLPEDMSQLAQASQALNLNVVSPDAVLFVVGCGAWVTEKRNGILLVDGGDGGVSGSRAVEWIREKTRTIMPSLSTTSISVYDYRIIYDLGDLHAEFGPKVPSSSNTTKSKRVRNNEVDTAGCENEPPRKRAAKANSGTPRMRSNTSKHVVSVRPQTTAAGVEEMIKVKEMKEKHLIWCQVVTYF